MGSSISERKLADIKSSGDVAEDPTLEETPAIFLIITAAIESAVGMRGR